MKKLFTITTALLLLCGLAVKAQTQSNYFITEFNTALDSTSDGKSIAFYGEGSNYIIMVSGLDTSYTGTLTSVNGYATIPVPKAGAYTVIATAGSGRFDGYSNYGGGSGDNRTDSRDMLTKIVQWGNFEWHKLNFAQSDNLDVIATDVPNVSKMVSLQGAFAYCFALKGNESFGRWDVSNIQVMYQMFQGDQLFDQDLSAWNLKSASNLAQMFGYTGLSKCNYTKILNAWAANPNTANEVFFNNQDGCQYSDSTGRSILINQKKWRIAGDVFQAGGNCGQVISAVAFGNIVGAITNGQLTINWQTTKEQNADHFEIEASNDTTKFDKIGTVSTKATNGSSSATLSYTFSKAVSSIPSMALVSAGAFMLLFFAVPRKRSRTLLAMGCLIIISASCKKAEPDIPVDDNSKTLYVRIKYVDKAGNTSYSKTIKTTEQ